MAHRNSFLAKVVDLHDFMIDSIAILDGHINVASQQETGAL
jgi:hypothetical protein